jgi:glycogen operon protein
VQDITWFDPSGQEMSEDAWNTGYARCLGVRLAGDLIEEVDERGEPMTDESFLLLLNAHYEPIPFTLPVRYEGQHWERLLDTAVPQGEPETYPAGQPYEVQGRSMAVLCSQPPQRAESAEPVAASAVAH